MKRVSLRDFHMRTSALVKEAAEGEVIIIQKRGVDVAVLRPHQKPAEAQAFQDLKGSGYFKKVGKTNTQIDRIISEDRNR